MLAMLLSIFAALLLIVGLLVVFRQGGPSRALTRDKAVQVLEDVLAGKKLANEPSAFNQEAIAEEFFENMFEAAKHIPQWIISLGQNKKDVGFTPERLLEMVEKHRKAEVQILEHKWIMNNAVGRDQKDNIEYLIVTL